MTPKWNFPETAGLSKAGAWVQVRETGAWKANLHALLRVDFMVRFLYVFQKTGTQEMESCSQQVSGEFRWN
jgi:hypothetical protein